jgi:hypothetical protein
MQPANRKLGFDPAVGVQSSHLEVLSWARVSRAMVQDTSSVLQGWVLRLWKPAGGGLPHKVWEGRQGFLVVSLWGVGAGLMTERGMSKHGP